jgi:hypothetical protein
MFNELRADNGNRVFRDSDLNIRSFTMQASIMA